MKNVLVAFFVLFAVFASAQDIRLEGVITAEKESIQMGQVTIFSLPDSTLKKGTYLDSSYFSLTMKAEQGNAYYAKFNLPNYLDTTIQFTANDTVVNLGVITPVKNTDLETVDVVYRKEMFKRSMDGISVSVEGTTLQTLTNLFEVLKASPKITSPDDESIEIIGRGSPLILVDRQAIISNDELKAIPASQIERIEIITNPSAKYKAQGSGNGVIEVYTKSFHLEGYNMTLRTQAGMNTKMRPTAGLHAGISLKKKKFSVNGYLGGNYESSFGYGETDGFTTQGEDRSMHSQYDFYNQYLWQYYNLKSAYNFSEKQRLTAGVSGYGSAGAYHGTSQADYYVGTTAESQSSTASESDWTWLNNSAFLNYTVETDTNRSNLELNLNYTNKISGNDDISSSEFEYVPTAALSRFDVRNDARDIPNVGEFRVNYEHVFDTTRWKLGVGSSYSALFNGKRFDQYNYADGDWIVDPDFSNSYDYQEHIGAAFAEVSKNWDKFGFRLGVRTEYTRLDGYSNSLNQQFMDSSYVLAFPSASILINPSDKVALTLFYDSGIDRPEFESFDPFVRVSDSLSVEYGNPFLRPAVEQTIGFDLDLFYAYNISITYSHERDPYSTVSFIDEGSFLRESTPWNAEAEQTLSASLSIPFQTSWLQGWNSIWVDYSKYTFTPIFEREPFFNLTYGAYSYLTFTLPKDFMITNRMHVNKWGTSENDSRARFNWGLRFTKKYKGNNFQIFADIGNIIPTKNISTFYTGNYQYTSTSQNQFTTFKVGLFYKFGRLKAADHIEESSSGQSDRL